jgi:hypothetical protein
VRCIIFVAALCGSGLIFADQTFSCFGEFEFTREKNGSKKAIPVKVEGSFDLHLKNRKGQDSFSEAVWEERLNGETTNTRFDLTQDDNLLNGANLRDSPSTTMKYSLSYNLVTKEAVYLFEGRAKKKDLYLKKYFKGICK